MREGHMDFRWSRIREAEAERVVDSVDWVEMDGLGTEEMLIGSRRRTKNQQMPFVGAWN